MKFVFVIFISLLIICKPVYAADVLPPKGVLVRDSNGEPFMVSGSGNILQSNFTYGTHYMINSVDYEMELGAPVMAAFPGIITRVDADNVHGVFVIVEGDNGIAGRYYHLMKSDFDIMSKKVGQRVELGDKLGCVGRTGNTCGNHYGLEIGLIDPHNPKNNYYSSTYEHRAYYDAIINKLFSGQYDEWEVAQERNANEDGIKNNERRITK